MATNVRVAAAQFAVGVDVDANLAACLLALRAAGACKPDLVVLPEFANHASWYDDAAHCWRVSVDIDGDFLRALALRGAQILCNSLNSFALDEGSLHIPVRAAENRVFVVAANKIGALIPEALLEPVSAQTGIPVRFLSGAGDSQIVAPDGTVL